MATPQRGLFLDLQRQVDLLFENLIYRRWAIPWPGGWNPPLDLHETADAYFVEIDLPGVTPEEARLAVGEQTLTISGRRQSLLPEGTVLNHCERHQGEFLRSLNFPRPIIPEAAEAELVTGICRIRLPKKPLSKLPDKETVRAVGETRYLIQITVR